MVGMSSLKVFQVNQTLHQHSKHYSSEGNINEGTVCLNPNAKMYFHFNLPITTWNAQNLYFKDSTFLGVYQKLSINPEWTHSLVNTILLMSPSLIIRLFLWTKPFNCWAVKISKSTFKKREIRFCWTFWRYELKWALSVLSGLLRYLPSCIK